MGIWRKLIVGVLVGVSGGCVLPDKFLATGMMCPAPTQVVAAWNSKIIMVPDPARGGTPAPGITGRVYIFGITPDFPIEGNGSIVVDLFDDSGKSGQPAGTVLEEWRFDPVTLKRLFKRDTIGMGYTLFLPWGTYRPDINQVHLAVRYEPLNGTPLYSVSGTQSLDHGATKSPAAH